MKQSTLKLSLYFFLLTFTFNSHAQFNLAQGKKATQSSNYNAKQGQAYLAVDGNTSGNWKRNSVTHTRDGGTGNPWWQVDLGAYQDIKEILVWNRTDCCKKRLDNLVVSVETVTGWKRVNKNNHRFSSGIQYPLKFKVGKKARKVKLQLMNPKGILSLAEVQVIGDAIKDTKRVVSSTVKKAANAGVALANETRKGVKTIRNEIKKAKPIYARATPLKAPKKCKDNSFYDVSKGQCWTCPRGYKRTIAAVNSANACERAGGERFAKAITSGKGTGLLGTDCKPGYFWDPNGKCYKCPSGYNRTGHAVTSSKACSQKVNSSFTHAKPVGSAGCSTGIYDIGTEKCWSCPNGYRRTVFPVNGAKACEKPKGR